MGDLHRLSGSRCRVPHSSAGSAAARPRENGDPLKPKVMFTDVEIRFEREALDGVVAVGTYLNDAAKRLGIPIDADCVPMQGIHSCEVTITAGAELVSSGTTTETEHFAGRGRKGNERLACEARIEKSGEIMIMTKEKA